MVLPEPGVSKGGPRGVLQVQGPWFVMKWECMFDVPRLVIPLPTLRILPKVFRGDARTVKRFDGGR